MSGLPRVARRRVLPLIVAAVALALTATLAFAFYSGSSSAATGSISVGALAAPTGVSAQTTGTSVAVSWTGSSAPTGESLAGYYVQRVAGATTAPACGSSPSSLLAATATSCTDTGSPAGDGVPAGSYVYEVTAVWRSWTATSGASSSVTVAPPTVTSLSPGAAEAGATNYDVTINGSNFVDGATVDFGSGITVDALTYDSAASLTARVTVATSAVTGARDVKVTNPDGDTATGSGLFTVNPGPAITAVVADSADQGAHNDTVKVDGTGFESGANVSFSNSGVSVNSTTFVSSTQLTANITVPSGASTGTSSVNVANPDGSTASTDGWVYWANGGCCTATPSIGTIGQADLDGSDANQRYVNPPGNSTNLQGLAAGANGLYWADAAAGTIGHANTDGSSANNSFVVGSRGTAGVAVDGTHVYWDQYDQGQVWSANLDGSSPTAIVGGANHPTGLAAASGSIYWTNSYGSIGQATSAGGSPNQNFISIPTPAGGVTPSPAAVAVAHGYIYWTDQANNTIGRASLDGSGANDRFITGAATPYGIAVNSSRIYWSNYNTNTIGSANLDGSGANQSFITGAANPYGVAVKSAFTVYPGPAVASTSPSSGTPGASNLSVTVTGTGFESGATAAFSNPAITVNSASYVSSTQLTANISIAAGASGGPGDVTVTNPDGSSATGSGAFSVVLTAPTVTTQASNPTANTSPSFSFSGGNGSGYQCQLDGGSFSSCSSPVGYSGLANGSHTVAVRATAGAATGSPASYTIKVDAAAPSITTKPSDPTANASPALGFTDAESAYTFKCSLDGASFASCYRNVVSANSPGAYFRMDSTSTMTDSAGGHTGTLTGATAATGAIADDSDGALSFPTAGTGYTEPYVPRTAFTLEAWVKTGSGTLGSTCYPCAWYDGESLMNAEVGGVTSDFGVTLDGGHVAFGIGAPDTTIWSPGTINNGAYHLIDATWSASDGHMALYIDGNLVQSGNGPTGARNAPGIIYGGSSYVNQANSVGPLALDEIAVYPSRLSATQIATDYTTGTTGATSYSALGDGSHSFQVEALSADGATTQAATDSWHQVTVGPTQAFSLAPGTTDAAINGTTVYYDGGSAGTLAFVDSETANSLTTPASATFPAIATAGWTHAAETVTSPTGGPYQSSTFSWLTSSTNPGSYAVTGKDALGNATTTGLTFVDDTTAPTGGALSVNGAAATSSGSSSLTDNTSFSIGGRSDWQETQSATQSGLRSSILTVQSEATTGTVPGAGSCGAPGSGGPFANPAVVSGTTQPAGLLAGYCYLYTLTGIDNVGNATSISTTVQVAMKLWAQASAIAQAGGSTVGQWPDSSPFANTLTTQGSAPTLLSNQWNGQPAVAFYGSAADLTSAQNMAGGSAPYDVFVVAQPYPDPNSAFGTVGYFGWGNPGTAGDEVVLRANNGNGTGLDTYWFGYDDYQNAPVSQSSPNLIESYWDGSTRGMALDGTSLSNYSLPAADKTTVSTPFRLGESALSTQIFTQPFHGEIAEAIVYEGPLSSSERAAISSYLMGRYAVP